MAALSNFRDLDLAHAPALAEPCLRPTTADLGTLFRLYAQFIARSLRRLGVPDSDVDDAVQEVFVVASRKLEAIQEGAERSFLYGTAMRIASNAHRVERRAQSRRADTPEGHEHLEVDAAPSAEELIGRREAREALDAVLETMSFEMRAVFTLFEFEEMTTVEIASLLDVPAGTVSSRLSRARKHFERQVRVMQDQLERRERKP
jgi:RNA polymerase sigma-70 factor (ECF subfamily)